MVRFYLVERRLLKVAILRDLISLRALNLTLKRLRAFQWLC